MNYPSIITPGELYYDKIYPQFRDTVDQELIFYLTMIMSDAIDNFSKNEGIKYWEDSSYQFSSVNPSIRSIVQWFDGEGHYEYQISASGELIGEVPPQFEALIQMTLDIYKSKLPGIISYIVYQEVSKQTIADLRK